MLRPALLLVLADLMPLEAVLMLMSMTPAIGPEWASDGAAVCHTRACHCGCRGGRLVAVAKDGLERRSVVLLRASSSEVAKNLEMLPLGGRQCVTLGSHHRESP